MKRALAALAGVVILGGCSHAEPPVSYQREQPTVSVRCLKAAAEYLAENPDAYFVCNDVRITP